MRISVNPNKSLVSFLNTNLDDVVNKALIQATLLVQNKAKVLAPYDTGTLRRSITSDFSLIKQGMTIVGSPVPYAKRRHYENNKNPDRLYYLHRAYEENKKEIKKLFSSIIKKGFR